MIDGDMSNRLFKVLFRTAIWSFAACMASSWLPWIQVNNGSFTTDFRGTDYRQGNIVFLLGLAGILAVTLFKRSRATWTIHLAPLLGLAVTVMAVRHTIWTSLLVDDVPVQARVGLGLVVLLFAGPLALATSSVMAWEVFKSRGAGRDFFAGPGLYTGLPWWRAHETEQG